MWGSSRDVACCRWPLLKATQSCAATHHFVGAFNGNDGNNNGQRLLSSSVTVRYKSIWTCLPHPRVFLSDSLQGDIPQTWDLWHAVSVHGDKRPRPGKMQHLLLVSGLIRYFSPTPRKHQCVTSAAQVLPLLSHHIHSYSFNMFQFLIFFKFQSSHAFTIYSVYRVFTWLAGALLQTFPRDE